MNPKLKTKAYRPADGEDWVPSGVSRHVYDPENDFALVDIPYRPVDDVPNERLKHGRPANPIKLRWKYSHMAYEVVRLEKLGVLPVAAKQIVARAWSKDGLRSALRTVETALTSTLTVLNYNSRPCTRYATLRDEAEARLTKYLIRLETLRK